MRRTRIEQVVIHFIFWLIVAFCLVPFLLLITASFTDEDAIIREGYSFFPVNGAWIVMYSFFKNRGRS